jgi:hypothetical protein
MYCTTYNTRGRSFRAHFGICHTCRAFRLLFVFASFLCLRSVWLCVVSIRVLLIEGVDGFAVAGRRKDERRGF